MILDDSPAYVIVPTPQNLEIWSDQKLKTEIENGDTNSRIEALKQLIFMLSNDQKLSKDMLMFVIRFLIPCTDKSIKKLLLLFWELVPKYQAGKMISEMILVCDAYRKDLQHPNEFVRGSILRFLCKLKEPELLEPIMPAIRACLDHKTAYVRRNAVLAILTIFKNFDFLIPDAPELIERVLDAETDASCQRNAYMMLIQCDQQKRAINYLKNKVNSVLLFGDVLQLAIIELIYNHCFDSSDKKSFLPFLFELLNANSKAVQFSAANALLSLSDTHVAVEYAAKCYVNLITKESDNNVRLIILDCLSKIQTTKKNDWIFHELSLDLLSVLDTGSSDAIIDLEVARRIINLVNEVLPSDRSESAINFVRKELNRIQKRYILVSDKSQLNSSNRDVVEYNRALIKFIKNLLERHPDIHSKIIPMLVSYITSSHATVAQDILEIIKTIICNFSQSKEFVFTEISSILLTLSDSHVFRSALWILVSCILTKSHVETVISILESSISKDYVELAPEVSQKSTVVIAADGSYVTKSDVSVKPKNIPVLNKFIDENDTHICSSVATIVCKLAALLEKMYADDQNYNSLLGKLLHVLAKIVYVYEEKFKDNQNIDIRRTIGILKMLTSMQNFTPLEDFLQVSQQNTQSCIQIKESNEFFDVNIEKEHQDKDRGWKISFDSIIEPIEKTNIQNIYNESLLAATGQLNTKKEFSLSNRVIALTGLSDPIYAETCIKISHFDIYFDVLVVNQTDDYLQNVSLDMRTQGDFKVLNRSHPIGLSSYKFANISVCIRLTSSENNIIFGSVSYETTGPQRSSYNVILDEISLDLTENIVTHKCGSEAFQKMWAEFEWENKVPITTSFMDFKDFISFVCEKTKMSQVNENVQFDCKYLAVNLYSKNMFGDEALANISVEQQEETNSIIGQVRIRAKSQSIALSLGNKFSEILKKDS